MDADAAGRTPPEPGPGGGRPAVPGFVPADEGRHAPGEGPWWAERWWFCWWGDGGGFVELVLLPNARHGWYRSALVRPGEPLLVIADHRIPVPRVGLELRADGLWADHSVEEPFRQWTVANEAYALAVDDPDEIVGRGYGTPQPFALDAEWYAAAPAEAVPFGYEQRGELEGTVELGGGRRLEVAGPSSRSHTWGPLTLPPADDEGPALSAGNGWGVVPDRWPAPFDVVVDDLVGPTGWRRRRR